jgi:hydantoinase/carbamoylase family amidase
VFEDLVAWIELHIEQGRVLEDAGERIGVVEAIAGYVHADIEIVGRADHAGGTPMGLRQDAMIPAAQCVLEVERLALAAAHGAVATVGELTLEPGRINIIPGRARVSLDIRSAASETIDAIASEAASTVVEAAAARRLIATYRERQRVEPTALDRNVVGTLIDVVSATGVQWRRMVSGAAHDTMCIAPHVPSAMVFVPCRAGISHSPAEYASAADAALGVEVLVGAALQLAN